VVDVDAQAEEHAGGIYRAGLLAGFHVSD
jgi:hypothetical protein